MAMDKTLLLNAQAEKYTRGETCVEFYFCIIHDETQQCGSSAVTSGLRVCVCVCVRRFSALNLCVLMVQRFVSSLKQAHNLRSVCSDALEFLHISTGGCGSVRYAKVRQGSRFQRQKWAWPGLSLTRLVPHRRVRVGSVRL